MAELPKASAIKVALAGNPNSGKTTLFNVLTGLHQRTGNFPGVTIDKKSGITVVENPATRESITVELIDLPGAYSLQASSPDEKITASILSNHSVDDRPDKIVIVADASNLKRNLFFATQVMDQGWPVILVLTMMDIGEKQGHQLDISRLSAGLGIPVIPVNPRKKQGLDTLQAELIKQTPVAPVFLTQSSTNPTTTTIERYRLITALLEQCLKKTAAVPMATFTAKADRILLHKIGGYLIFLLILLMVFQSIFYLAAYPMKWIEMAFSSLSLWMSATLPPGTFTQLLVHGVLAGISGVVIFIPQIALLFAFLSILEDTGYMARVSFIMDRLMKKIGLNGRSVIPLISGMACAVPAIMGARIISNWKERLITILVTPLMSCSARLPVYTLLIALIVPTDSATGFFNMQGLLLMALYLIGFFAAIITAWMMKWVIRSKERSYFMMEMPVYRSPRWSSIGLTILEKVKIFVWDAGKVIVAIAVILWVLSSNAPGNQLEEIEKKYAATETPDSKKMAAEKLEASYAGIIGKQLEPFISPLGFNWKIGIALVTSFAAREVFIGTMATIYSAEDANNPLSVREKMQAEKDPVTGQAVFSIPVVISLLLFYAFAMQCMSTLAVVYRETHSWKWPLVQFLYMGILAYLSSFVAYQWLR